MSKFTDKEKVIHAILSNQIALHHNEEVKHTNFFKNRLKMVLNPAIKELVKHEPEFDMLFAKEEHAADISFEVYNKFLRAVASVPIYDCEVITLLIEELYVNHKDELEKLINKVINK